MGLPFGTCFVFSQCMLHVLAACNVWDYFVVMISDLCSFVKLSWMSLWIKASAKCINVNVNKPTGDKVHLNVFTLLQTLQATTV